MRILSLLPSATEIVFALGLGDQLVGVTHECDWPPEAASKPAVTASALPPASAPADVDRLVAESLAGAAPIYRLDEEAVAALRPDLVISQDLCAVCAVPSGHVGRALEVVGTRAQVLSLDPTSLADVIDCVRVVGEATGAHRRAHAVAEGLSHRLDAVQAAVSRRRAPRTFALEWSDPPFNAGHWVPDMLEHAGAEPVLGAPGTPSVRLEWPDVAQADPEVVVFIPCGYGLQAACAEARDVLARPELAGARAVFAADANAYFSRPGPRLVDGVELLASALHPGSVVPAVPEGIRMVREGPSRTATPRVK